MLIAPWKSPRFVAGALAAAVLFGAACGEEEGGGGGGETPPDYVLIVTAATSIADCADLPLVVQRRTDGGAVVDGASFGYSSTAPSVATVSGAGVVSAQGPGAVNIVVTSPSALPDTIGLTVNAQVGSFSVTHDTLTVAKGGTSAALNFLNCHGIAVSGTVYTSRQAAIATAASNGQITGVASGTTRIVLSNGVQSDSVWVRVSGDYAFVLDTTIGGGARYYTTAVSAAGVAYLTRPDAAKLARFDILTRTLNINASNVGEQAHGVTLDPAGTYAYVANQAGPTLNRVNTATGVAEAPISTGAMSPYQVVVSASQNSVVFSGNTDSLLITDLEGTALRRVGVAMTPIGLARRPNGEIIVTHLTNTELRRVNAGLTSSTLIRNLPAASNGVALSPSGDTAYVASEGGGALYVVNVATGDSITTIPISGAWGVAVTPNGARVIVTSLSGSVYSVRPANGWSVESIAVGGTPRGVAIQPNGWGIVVANEDGNLHLIR